MDNLLNKYVWLIETIYKAKNLNDNKVKIYALDRIHHLEVLVDKCFKMPDSFDPAGYFEECYGVIVVERVIETVELFTFVAITSYSAGNSDRK